MSGGLKVKVTAFAALQLHRSFLSGQFRRSHCRTIAGTRSHGVRSGNNPKSHIFFVKRRTACPASREPYVSTKNKSSPKNRISHCH